MNNLYPDIEGKDVSQIKERQFELLKDLLEYVNEHSVFYKDHFSANNISPDDIKSLSDLNMIPSIAKKDLQNRNKDFWCVGSEDIIDYCNTSGTEGQPVTVPLTKGDLDRLAYNEAISLACANGTPDDIFQLSTTIDRRFMAGLAYAQGVISMGAGLVRVGPAPPELQWLNIKEIKPTTLIIVPSFLVKLIDYAEKNMIDYKSSSIKKAVCIGEPIRDDNLQLNSLGRRIKESWDIELFSTYASTEMGTAFTECEFGIGGHEHPELIISEILDEEGQVVEDGEFGELTITTLGVEGMPLIRFRTGDICRKYTDKCKCGRTTSRLGPLLGRKNQMIKYKGTTIYPPSIFDVMDKQKFVSLYCIEISEDDYGNDKIIVRYSAEKDYNIEDLKKQFRSRVRATPELIEGSFEDLFRVIHPKNSRKPVKYFDFRSKKK
ncbi:phenylacetate--CoA ligase family protein [Marinigracilibium pacificum]|uniref:Phenylacetate--CoA ligase n=1 Tax=Marinigracilibium pacificum TaxID=2729599 RepID=A0A848IX67_9BACT|nr:AMP-binding protein [Marinigracilibium pacificum]NMM47875.1 phenylacetate--CoA ligase [Marinigracilibium pacificum]